MASIRKRAEGQWEARIRRKGYPMQSATFPTSYQAERWSREIDSQMDRRIFKVTSKADR